MLLEWLSYLTTPCDSLSRKEGYLREAVAIEARYRRCVAAWQSHLENSKQVILEASAACSCHQKILILGSGALLDIPVEVLSEKFAEVWLVDRVHPKRARRRVVGMGNVRLVEADAGGVSPVPFPGEEGADLVVSANLLSQLPLLPVSALRRRGAAESEAQALGRVIVETHLVRLAQLSARWCLITDTVRQRINDAGEVVLQEDALFGVTLSPLYREWDWDIAPRGEIERDHRWRHRVGSSASQ